MGSVRTFVAIGLSAEVRDALALCQERLGSVRARFAKWTDPEGIHLTLKFLGNVDESMLPRLADALRRAVSTTPAFRLETGQLGAFPNTQNPRVVWLGLEGDLQSLQALQQAVEAGLEPLGFPPEGRGFTPHLTLARVRETATRADRLELARSLSAVQAGSPVGLRVDDILVMKSELDRAGARYTQLYSIPLPGHT